MTDEVTTTKEDAMKAIADNNMKMSILEKELEAASNAKKGKLASEMIKLANANARLRRVK